MGLRDETVMFRVIPARGTCLWQGSRSEPSAPAGAINWLMGRGEGMPDAIDGGVWISAISWVGRDADEWPDKDIVVGQVGALLGPGGKSMVEQLLQMVFGDYGTSDVDAVLHGQLRVTNVRYSQVPSWYLSMNYVLTSEGARRANHALVTGLQSIHTSAMSGGKGEFHTVAPEKEVSSEAVMYRWLEQVAGMGLTYGLHTVLSREQSQNVHAVPPMFIVAGTTAVSLGAGCYAALPSADGAHEWVILPCTRDGGGCLTVKKSTVQSYTMPRFLVTVRPSTSPGGALVLASSSLISTPTVVLQHSKAPSAGILSDGPYKWDCTAYGGSTDPIRVQKLVSVDKTRGVRPGELTRTTVLHTHDPGVLEVKRGTSLVYTAPRTAWLSFLLDSASTFYTVILAALVASAGVSYWARVTFVIEILAQLLSRASALMAWSGAGAGAGAGSSGRDSGLLRVVIPIVTPIHWVLRNGGQDAERDGWLWRAPLRSEAWGALLSLGPLSALVSLDEATSYQVALLAVVSTVLVGSLRFTELWEELIGVSTRQSSGVCASFCLMYLCGLFVQSSFLVVDGNPWWAMFGVVLGAVEAMSAVRGALTLMKALVAVGSGRGEVLQLALSSQGGLLGAVTMSGDSLYGDIWNWKVLAIQESSAGLVWSPASVSSIVGGDLRGLSFTEVNIADDTEVRLLSAYSEDGTTEAATHVLARNFLRPIGEAMVEVMPGGCSGLEAIRRSAVDPEYDPIFVVQVGLFFLPIAPPESPYLR